MDNAVSRQWADRQSVLISLGYIATNVTCRVGGNDLAEYTSKMLKLFSTAPPLPASVVISRGLRGAQFQNLPLNQIQTEHGFMSTSLVGLAPSFFNTTNYMYLKVPAGTPVIAILAVSNRQQELVFPPGTRYILHRRIATEGFVKYEGEIIP